MEQFQQCGVFCFIFYFMVDMLSTKEGASLLIYPWFIKWNDNFVCLRHKINHIFYLNVDDVLSINNSRFAEILPLIYPPELEAKETTDTASFASLLDLYLEFDDSGQLSTKIYDFKIINFPNMGSNIQASPAYCVYTSQLIRYARASSNYSDFLKRHLHMRNRLLDQGYKKIRL